jgi:hypothetical protein
MRTLYALAVFIGTTIASVVLMGALGGVGSIELLLAVVLAAAITVLWVHRRTGRPAHQP